MSTKRPTDRRGCTYHHCPHIRINCAFSSVIFYHEWLPCLVQDINHCKDTHTKTFIIFLPLFTILFIPGSGFSFAFTFYLFILPNLYHPIPCSVLILYLVSVILPYTKKQWTKSQLWTEYSQTWFSCFHSRPFFFL